jgi:hypothetical protein
MTATHTWRMLLTELLSKGVSVQQASAGAAWRGRTSRELLAHRTVWPMDRAVVACPGRKLGYHFLAAEAAWVLSGRNDLAGILPYARYLSKLAENGFMSGAYGPPFVEQLPYVIKALTEDRGTRQAVMTIWRPRPMASADIPCTVALQWLIREDAGVSRLHCIATMRSSDAWMGVPYDVHTFSMMSAMIALQLRDLVGRLGTLYLTAGSQHLYLLDEEAARASSSRDDELFDLKPLDLEELACPENLTCHLWDMAEKRKVLPLCSWLLETI